MYTLQVTYDADRYPDMDYRLEAAMGRDSDGSGMGFGGRDISWSYKRYAWAEKAGRRLKRRFRGLQIRIYDEESDDEESFGLIFEA